MFILYADKTQLAVQQREPMTSGSVNTYQVWFKFSADWSELTKTACFRTGTQTISVLLDDSDRCVVPWEVTDLDDAGKRLSVGVYGVRNGEVVLPTVWADCGVILPGTACGSSARPPTPGLYDQLLARMEQKQDKLTGLPGQMAVFDENGRLAARDITDSPIGAETATDEEVTQMLDEVFDFAGK